MGLTYRYGNTSAIVSLSVEMNYEVRKLCALVLGLYYSSPCRYNVRAKIVGSAEPDKVVLVGNHHGKAPRALQF